ncbi:sam dependent methyltransferase [Grosmannia clavigera kw1407]|uniref:Sam dependent methyltransferase n=1 Tax=Grosmannia clavigera (strain kw1407 / UAMH 11150) TaxID=655863 RepID=F0XEW1_GROCL|nr:sam dependent methyltransferase [Grosmannia clavigera kw1407]EFX03433.1 sam dependent methyltransferase [Grosmannia clavigera kw1407]
MTSRDALPRSLILQHESFRALLDGRLLQNVPAEPVGRVLDLGTGCGIWAADFAKEHPAATVIGIDVFPQPTVVPPSNCSFLIRDAEQDWDFGDGGFDLIHTRLVPFHAAAVRSVLRCCYVHLRPGGCIEMQEVWPPYRTDEPAGAPEHQSSVMAWTRLRLQAAARLGIDQAITSQLPALLAEAGFVAVQSHELKWPIGPWMADRHMQTAGTMHTELLRCSLQGLSTNLLAEIGMSESQVDELLVQVRQELGVGKIYAPVRIVCAWKPES